MSDHNIILASASPRRAELLKQLGWQPDVRPVDIDESVTPGEAPEAYCLRMAVEKARHAQQEINSHLPVLTADTIVVVDDEILGKPDSVAHALATLQKLSGRVHHVYSAVALVYAGDMQHVVSRNAVTMATITPQQAQAYIQTGEPMDKAGAYAIQGYAAMWIKRIEGSYSSIMGLPLFETTQLLNKLAIMSPLDSLKHRR